MEDKHCTECADYGKTCRGNCDDIKDRIYDISHGHGDCFKPKEKIEPNLQPLIEKYEADNARLQEENSFMIKELASVLKERDAAIADLTEFAMFHKRQTICNFCAYDDDDEDCKGRDGDNGYMNECFKWRGPI